MNARRHARHFEDRPTDVLGWAEAIQKSELDVLIYPAIGMDPISSQLASLRLAPIQITTWGHPETSGLNTIDYYLSGENLEPENAQGNYTEQLIKLPNLSVMVEPLKPKVYDPGLDRIGLPKNESLILCPGSPFKYSPVHDWVWIEIAKELERRQHGRLVFFSGSRGAMYGILQKRLRHAFEAANLDFDARVQVVPQLDRPRFFGLMQRSALMLDTIGFSGFNTGLQAIECGLPILTYEGDFMRGRLASCFMRRMDIPELVASSEPEFIARAVELSQDAGARKRLTKEIGKRRKLLFADLAPVRALEEFLGSSTHAA
jgi:predicted O-linked N-acetylglucosamine transferase (SPINDLY family)